jgi:hypothetical protein
MLPLQRVGQKDGLRSAPAMSKNDDSRLAPLECVEGAVTVGVQKAEDVAESLLS